VTSTIAAAEATPPAAKSLPARLIGVLTSPRDTYASVAAQPRWLGAIAFAAVVGALSLYVFLSTDVGRQALLDQQVRVAESFGVKMTDAAYQRLEAGSQLAPYTSSAGQLVGLPIIALVVAGIMIGVFNAVLGGNATFTQVYAVVAHSAIVLTLAQLFGLPLAYARQSMSGATNLGVFLPFLDDTSFLARFFGSIDLFYVWWMVSLSIGLGVLFKKRTTPIATSLLVVYVLIALVVAAARTALSGA
jgi:hypothetical protein